MSTRHGWTAPDLVDARRALRIGCEHPAPITITTLGSPAEQYLCNTCGLVWEVKRETPAGRW